MARETGPGPEAENRADWKKFEDKLFAKSNAEGGTEAEKEESAPEKIDPIEYIESTSTGALIDNGELPPGTIKKTQEKPAFDPIEYIEQTSTQALIDNGELPPTTADVDTEESVRDKDDVSKQPKQIDHEEYDPNKVPVVIDNKKDVPAVIEEDPEEPKSEAPKDDEEPQKQIPHIPYDPNKVPVVVESESEPEQQKSVKLKAAVVDTSDSLKRARHVAEAEMTASKEEMKGARGFFRRVWKHGLTRYVTEARAEARARAQMLEKQNVYIDLDDAAEVQRRTNIATTERFIAEYEDTVHAEAGEVRDQLGDTEVEQNIKHGLQELVRAFAGGDLNEESFEEEKKRLLGDLQATRGDVLDKGLLYADNLLELAKQVKEMGLHGEALAQLDIQLDLTLGRAKTGARTEAQLNACERTIEWMRNHKLGFVNETTVATAVAAGYQVGALLSQQAARSKLLAWGTTGLTAVLGGTLAGARESHQTTRERAQHMRERAEGTSFNTEAQRRNEMEAYKYETRSANELRTELESCLAGELEGEAKDVALAKLAEVDARIRLSDSRAVDLIGYSDVSLVESERQQLDLARAKLRASLRSVESDLDTQLEQRSNLVVDALVAGDEGIEAKDSQFKKYKRKRVAGAVVKGTVIGGVIGTAAQEVGALVNDDQVGIVEGAIKGSSPNDGATTALEGLRRYIEGDWSMMPTGTATEIATGADEILRLPGGVTFVPDGSGSYSLMRGSESICDGLTLDADGKLTPAALSILDKEGIDVISSTATTSSQIQVPISRNAQQYASVHGSNLTAIERQFWNDNGTPLVFDHNELRLHLGGINDTGINTNGDFEFDVSTMTPTGSSHNGVVDNFRDSLKTGHAKLMLSMSRATQNMAFEIDIQPDGKIVIPKGSEAARVLFENNSGQAVFKGAFAEVVAVGDKVAPSGAEEVRMFATHVGEGLNEPLGIEDTITETVYDVNNITELDIPNNEAVLPPPIVPIFGRRPLESSEKLPVVYPYYGAGSAEIILQDFERRGIKRDSYKVETQDGKRVLLHENGDTIKRDVERETERINKYLQEQDPAYLDELEELNGGLTPMSEKCRLAVIVPARMEGKNIVDLLDQYAQQTDSNGNPIDSETFEINIIVNRKKSEEPDDTTQFISNWKNSHPDIRVNVIDVAFEDEKACVGLARKYVTDLSLLRSVARSAKDGPLYIESEDADLTRVDKRTVSKLVKDFDESPEVDVLRGVQDRQPEILQQNDLLFFQRRLWDFMEVFMRGSKHRPDTNSDANFVWNRVISGGWNTAYTAESYAQIGGYSPGLVIGEDMEIGQRISVLRGSQSEDGSRFIPNTWTARTSGLRANSSPRRFIDAMARDISPYDDFEDQSLKQKTIPELLDTISEYKKVAPGHHAKYEAAVNTAFAFCKEVFAGSPDWKKVAVRGLFHLGLKEGAHYNWQGDHISISEEGMAQIAENMKSYRQEDKWKLGYQRQGDIAS